jgi:DNA-binding Lrp family transcriptional regulator
LPDLEKGIDLKVGFNLKVASYPVKDCSINVFGGVRCVAGLSCTSRPDALGLNFSAMVFATLRRGDRQAVEALETALLDIPQVVDARRSFGEADYLLHVIPQDLPAFQRLYDESLSTLPNVQRLTSTLVMMRVIHDRPLPL